MKMHRHVLRQREQTAPTATNRTILRGVRIDVGGVGVSFSPLHTRQGTATKFERQRNGASSNWKPRACLGHVRGDS